MCVIGVVPSSHYPIGRLEVAMYLIYKHLERVIREAPESCICLYEREVGVGKGRAKTGLGVLSRTVYS